MSSVAEAWSAALPEIRNGVTGRATWNALNVAKPLAIENGVLILGLEHKDRELIGHLNAAAVRRLIETEVGSRVGQAISVRIIDGATPADWERTKRKDQEAERLRDEAREKMKAELQAKSNWETVYESLSRSFGSMQNKTLPQNRAKFLDEAIQLVVDTRLQITERDDLSERNFARCLERVAQYTEIPAGIIAHMVMSRTGEF